LHKSAIIQEFQAAGFSVDVVHEERWDALPTRRSAMAREFRNIDAGELLTKSFTVVLRSL
jgi:hypothetical protein